MPALTVKDFGRQLVASGDLDPIYVMLNRAALPRPVLSTWCLTYWMFYHAGFASYVAEKAQTLSYWPLVQSHLPTAPRGTERRHFRAANAQKSVDYLARRFPDPVHAIDDLAMRHRTPPLAFEDVSSKVQAWVGFGPWIAFKVADMLDAVMGIPVDFSRSYPYFFTDPIKGAFLATWEWSNGRPAVDPEDRQQALLPLDVLPQVVREGVVSGAVASLQDALPGLKVQEAETILCKYKSHLNGHYPLGKDTKEIRHGLLDPRWGALARQLAGHLPADV